MKAEEEGWKGKRKSKKKGKMAKGNWTERKMEREGNLGEETDQQTNRSRPKREAQVGY